jgi:hypothetical protein
MLSGMGGPPESLIVILDSSMPFGILIVFVRTWAGSRNAAAGKTRMQAATSASNGFK